jgi:UDP-N-acetylglucosamine:LPS N-acetylglucosamine transferase
VDDLPDEKDRAEWLWEELERLMKDDVVRENMKSKCAAVARKDAAIKIAEKLLKTSNKMT